ncbi:MAG: flagellin FliC [Candidatus Schekmanbacteria bacterium]|nr:flagellin FliC [Candidatus Schekmanbacteria bacterium]
MAFRINNNIPAQNALRNLNITQNNLNGTVERLSSGLRINKAKDDAAGLAISEGMRSDIRVLRQGVRNANDAISVIQTAEGGMSQIGTILTRMKELAMESAGVLPDNNDRMKLDAEFIALSDELNRIASGTEFNGTSLLDGSFAGKYVHVGLGDDAGVDKVSITISASQTGATGFTSSQLLNPGGGAMTFTISTQDSAINVMARITTAIDNVNASRADLGALQSRFEQMIMNLENTIENTSAAESQIRDADIAYETTQFTKYQILQQSGVAMLAQANVASQSALSLLG